MGSDIAVACDSDGGNVHDTTDKLTSTTGGDTCEMQIHDLVVTGKGSFVHGYPHQHVIAYKYPLQG